MLSPTCIYPLSLQRSTFCIALAIAGLLAASAQALPIGEIRYDGPSGGYGTTAQTATASGVPIVPKATTDFLPATGMLYDRTRNPFATALGPPGRTSWNWDVTTSGDPGEGELYLVFVRPLSNTIQVNGLNQSVSYTPTSVGLTLQNAPGHSWVIFSIDTAGDSAPELYYPAVSLGSFDENGKTVDPFAVNYVLDVPQVFLDRGGPSQAATFKLGLPNWQLSTVFVPIPEPSPALFLGLGLTLLGIGRRLRS